ncbi:hypothetical protein [Occultella gossypii]|uniref:Uncharacterized protein n=1 Tax=Occultella gossypii TaxID=2800820 RepID=A0ABS7SAN8_9MICO|nr:hypothetical protein [Occultella gossypii]MBZ2197255.1 hypothetical protein [Occultella gossypii]
MNNYDTFPDNVRVTIQPNGLTGRIVARCHNNPFIERYRVLVDNTTTTLDIEARRLRRRDDIDMRPRPGRGPR